MFAQNKKRQTQAAGPRWLSQGTDRFTHRGILVNPAAVVFDAERAVLTVIVHALRSGSRTPAVIDLHLARITAFVVAGSLEPTLPRFSVTLYLRYPGDMDVEVDVRLTATARQIENRREQLRRRVGKATGQEPPVIPGQVLAYVLSTLPPIPPRS